MKPLEKKWFEFDRCIDVTVNDWSGETYREYAKRWVSPKIVSPYHMLAEVKYMIAEHNKKPWYKRAKEWLFGDIRRKRMWAAHQECSLRLKDAITTARTYQDAHIQLRKADRETFRIVDTSVEIARTAYTYQLRCANAALIAHRSSLPESWQEELTPVLTSINHATKCLKSISKPMRPLSEIPLKKTPAKQELKKHSYIIGALGIEPDSDLKEVVTIYKNEKAKNTPVSILAKTHMEKMTLKQFNSTSNFFSPEKYVHGKNARARMANQRIKGV